MKKMIGAVLIAAGLVVTLSARAADLSASFEAFSLPDTAVTEMLSKLVGPPEPDRIVPAIPEPATTVMLLAGLVVVVGVAARRRSKR